VEAVRRLLARGDRVCITAQNLIEFWAVATRPTAANGLGWTVVKAKTEVERLLDQFPLLLESPAVFVHWRQLVATLGVEGKNVHDARLIAVMRAHGVTHFLTFNTEDFSRYPGIVLVHPSEVP
jgi:predicted nucleic acid-binding protein